MSTHDQFLAELQTRIAAEGLPKPELRDVTGFTGLYFGDKGFIYVSKAKTDGPRVITTSVPVQGRRLVEDLGKRPNGKVRSQFKSDDTGAIEEVLLAIASGDAKMPERRAPQARKAPASQAPLSKEEAELFIK